MFVVCGGLERFFLPRTAKKKSDPLYSARNYYLAIALTFKKLGGWIYQYCGVVETPEKRPFLAPSARKVMFYPEGGSYVVKKKG